MHKKTQAEIASTMTEQQLRDLWYEEYTEKGLTAQQIADNLNCSKSTLRKLLERVGIKLSQGRPAGRIKFKTE